MWDLATRENWELILSETRTVTYKDGTLPTNEKYNYTPIQPIFTNPNSHTVLVGTHSNSAPAHWFLGARVSQYLYVSPSTNTNLISGVGTSEIKRAVLGQLTLMQFPNYNVLPYTLQIEIPYWIEDIYVEVWEYEDDVISQELQELESVKAQLHDIEDKLDALFN